jgi:hypothetical protein
MAGNTQKKTLWFESASELYLPSDRRFLATDPEARVRFPALPGNVDIPKKKIGVKIKTRKQSYEVFVYKERLM